MNAFFLMLATGNDNDDEGKDDEDNDDENENYDETQQQQALEQRLDLIHHIKELEMQITYKLHKGQVENEEDFRMNFRILKLFEFVKALLMEDRTAMIDEIYDRFEGLKYTKRQWKRTIEQSLSHPRGHET